LRKRVIRTWAKAAVVGTGFGLAAGVALYLGWDRVTPEWINVIEEWLSWPLPFLEIVFPGSSVKVRTAILAFASVAAPIIMGHRPLVDRLWPEPPEILDFALFRQDVYPDDPRFAGRAFIGRTDEMRVLMMFAGATGGEAAKWCTLTAPHGIGKTRLAVEWLDRLQKRKWDAGFLDTGASMSDIEKAHFRRNTAIVIDEALRDELLWPKLNALLAARRRVRILVIDQVPIRPPETLAKAMRDRIETAQLGGLRIERLDRDALAAIAPEAETRILDRADGRPLYVLLGPDPAATVARRVAERFEIANDDEEKALLAFAALAGPVENAVWQDQHNLPAGISLSRRARLFGGVDKDALRRVLPALAPEPFGDALLLAWATDEDDAARDKLF
jgi:hypothetical protein